MPARLCVDRVRRPCIAAGAAPHSRQRHPPTQQDIRRTSGGRRVGCTGSQSSRAASRRQATAGEVNLAPGCFARQLHWRLVRHRAKINFIQARGCCVHRLAAPSALGQRQRRRAGASTCWAAGRRCCWRTEPRTWRTTPAWPAAKPQVPPCSMCPVGFKQEAVRPADRQACEVPARMTTAQPRVARRAGSSMRNKGADAKRPLDTSPLLPHKRRQLVRSRSHVMSC